MIFHKNSDSIIRKPVKTKVKVLAVVLSVISIKSFGITTAAPDHLSCTDLSGETKTACEDFIKGKGNFEFRKVVVNEEIYIENQKNVILIIEKNHLLPYPIILKNSTNIAIFGSSSLEEPIQVQLGEYDTVPSDIKDEDMAAYLEKHPNYDDDNVVVGDIKECNVCLIYGLGINPVTTETGYHVSKIFRVKGGESGLEFKKIKISTHNENGYIKAESAKRITVDGFYVKHYESEGDITLDYPAFNFDSCEDVEVNNLKLLDLYPMVVKKSDTMVTQAIIEVKNPTIFKLSKAKITLSEDADPDYDEDIVVLNFEFNDFKTEKTFIGKIHDIDVSQNANKWHPDWGIIRLSAEISAADKAKGLQKNIKGTLDIRNSDFPYRNGKLPYVNKGLPGIDITYSEETERSTTQMTTSAITSGASPSNYISREVGHLKHTCSHRNNADEGGLSTGAKAGIATGVTFLLLGAAGLTGYIVKKNKRVRSTVVDDETGMSYAMLDNEDKGFFGDPANPYQPTSVPAPASQATRVGLD